MYKIVFTDLDGTLLPEDKGMSAYTKEVIAKVRMQGVKFVLASGRSTPSMRPFYQELQLHEPMISYNGACIEVDGKPYYNQPLNDESASKLFEFAMAKEYYFHFYHADRLQTIERYLEHEEFVSYAKNSNMQVDGFSCDAVPLKDLTKWMFIDRDRAKLEQIAKEVEALLGDSVGMSFTSEYFFEVYNKEVNKGNAALQVMKLYGVDASQTISIGDNYNDMEMISVAQLGVAMVNAPEAVKALATLICPYTSDEDGVAKMLEDIFLRGE
jgi:Cof subfamily protein (haloacid dehalogenase superfamily)